MYPNCKRLDLHAKLFRENCQLPRELRNEPDYNLVGPLARNNAFSDGCRTFVWMGLVLQLQRKTSNRNPPSGDFWLSYCRVLARQSALAEKTSSRRFIPTSKKTDKGSLAN